MHGFGHQSHAPVRLAKHVSKLSAAIAVKFAQPIFKVVFFNAKRADHLAAFLFNQGKSLVAKDEIVKHLLRHRAIFVMLPSRHFAHAVHRRVFKKVFQIRLSERPQHQTLGLNFLSVYPKFRIHILIQSFFYKSYHNIRIHSTTICHTLPFASYSYAVLPSLTKE